ncbi:MAG: hypothetical protein ABIK44_07625, partial [candidate division WOR-3 bacterium]
MNGQMSLLEPARVVPERWLNAQEFLSGLKRVNIFLGGFGSGKTEVAVNFALHLAAEGKRVELADL